MSPDEKLPECPKAPADAEARLREAAARAFSAHAAEAQTRLGLAHSVWRRRLEPWLVAGAGLAFVLWALHYVLSR